jgi:serine/threonine protein kinase HipA of HipAB toxin-antitoxin module
MNNRRPEPSLDDLLNDPILHALLARDGLKVEEVRRFLDEMRQRLRLARRKAA